MNDNISNISFKRLQCIRLKLARYYGINLLHTPGKKTFIADALSRSCILSTDKKVNIVVSNIIPTINMLNNIRGNFERKTKNILLK